MKAVILLSGGIDSTTCLAIALKKGFECYAISFSYGQKHSVELQKARRIAKHFHVKKHIIVRFNMRKWGGSALTSNSIQVPPAKANVGIPVTYVPARNTIFLSFAVSFAETIRAKDIFIGVNSMDYSGYPDCRPKFIKAFEKTANLGTKAIDENWKFKIHAPLQKMTKSEIIRLGNSLGIDYSMTISCYNPDKNGKSCGKCDSCVIRAKGFEEANTSA